MVQHAALLFQPNMCMPTLSTVSCKVDMQKGVQNIYGFVHLALSETWHSAVMGPAASMCCLNCSDLEKAIWRKTQEKKSISKLFNVCS